MDHFSQQKLHRLALLLAGGGRRCRRLVAESAATDDLLRAIAAAGAPQDLVQQARRLAADEAEPVLQRLARRSWRWIVPDDAEFPALLRHVADPPLGLFVRGNLEWRSAAAIVGSRNATQYGRQVARLLGEEMAAAGVCVVSGMARGVDAAAHAGALAAGGPTAAVWGTGPDEVYPRENAELAEEIAAHGALLTEFPPGTPPRRYHFPQRNRLIAGLAHALVVVEAGARSGALITARLALEEGREVLAVPGSIFSELSVGTNALLRVGARPLLTPRDLLEELEGAAHRMEPEAVLAGLPDEASGLLQWLPRGEALLIDELAERSGLEVHQLLVELLDLELNGSVERLEDGRYARR